jgi:NADPH-dependent curcumin reductase CurA
VNVGESGDYSVNGLANVDEFGKSAQHGLANVSEYGESAQHNLANLGKSGESAQHGLANVGESGESRIFLKTAVLASTPTRQKWQISGEYLNSLNLPASRHCLNLT